MSLKWKARWRPLLRDENAFTGYSRIDYTFDALSSGPYVGSDDDENSNFRSENAADTVYISPV